MRIFISGGLGFVGRYLSEFFIKKGYDVLAAGSKPDPEIIHHNRFKYISADLTQKGIWQQELKSADIIINLAGRSIFKRWTDSYKKVIYNSRILTTRNIVDQLSPSKPVTLINASAVGYYGDRGDDKVDEKASLGNDFLARLAVDWEQEADKGREKGARVVFTRFGIVLGRGGGAMEKMVPAFRYFVGGPQGNGRQWFPWIHIQDLCLAVDFVINSKAMSGPVNFCSPHPVRNKDLAKTVGRVLKRPSVMRVPAFVLRLVLGELGSALLSSQRCVPNKLMSSGYPFQFPEIGGAIENLLLE